IVEFVSPQRHPILPRLIELPKHASHLLHRRFLPFHPQPALPRRQLHSEPFFDQLEVTRVVEKQLAEHPGALKLKSLLRHRRPSPPSGNRRPCPSGCAPLAISRFPQSNSTFPCASESPAPWPCCPFA